MKLIYCGVLILLTWVSAKSQVKDQSIKRIILYSQNFKPDPATPVQLEDLFSLINYRLETGDKLIINAFQSYFDMMEARKRSLKEKKLDRDKWWGNYRIAVSIELVNQRAVTIAAGSRPYVYFDSKMYFDKEYNFLLLVNSQFDLPDLNSFLREKKLIP